MTKKTTAFLKDTNKKQTGKPAPFLADDWPITLIMIWIKRLGKH